MSRKKAVQNIDYASNDVVIKCHTGMAQAARRGPRLYGLGHDCGDPRGGRHDWLMVARSEQQAQVLVQELLQMIRGR